MDGLSRPNRVCQEQGEHDRFPAPVVVTPVVLAAMSVGGRAGATVATSATLTFRPGSTLRNTLGPASRNG